MTLQEAFGKLVTRRGWYKGSKYPKDQALRHKRVFLERGTMPEERMRHYLSAAGWVQTQQEEWMINETNDSKLCQE